VKDLKSSEGAHGICKSEEKIIQINETDNIKLFVQTLLHELCHAVFSESAIHETSVHEDVEEIIVEQISKAIVANFKIKPKEVDCVERTE